MPTDVFPNITIPVTSVVWIYSGLLPQQVEGRITYLFERFLTSTVEGIKYIHSHSYFGSSIINIYLQDGVDVGRAEADIAAHCAERRQGAAARYFPAHGHASRAILHTGGHARKSAPITMTPAELYNLVIMRIRPLLVTVPGAILPHPYGGQDMQVMVNLDQQKLLARHLTPADIHDALMKAISRAAGRRHQDQADRLDRPDERVTAEDRGFRRYPDQAGGQRLHLSARRRHGAVSRAGCKQNAVLVEGKQTVILVVMKSSEASTLDVVDGIKKMIPRIRANRPRGREDQAPQRRLDLREGFDRGRRA